MLKLFRKKNVARLVLWGILILILPAFVIWGSGSLGGSREKGPTFVGLINNKKVSFDDFAESLHAIRCQIILNYFNQPKVLDLFLNDKPFMGRLAWDRLIMAKEARKQKIKVPDQNVVNFIRSHPLFLRNGVFDEKLYDYILRNNVGMDPRTFEEIVRDNLAIKRLNDMLTKDIKITDPEILEAYKKDGEKNKQIFDEEKFKKEKDGYSKKALEDKKNKFLEDWLKKLELATSLNIDLKDYGKYYK